MADQLIDAEQLLAKMRAGTREVYEIKMRDLRIPVRMLTLDERLSIRNRAMVETRKVGGDDTYMAALVQKETLMLAASLNNGQTGVLSERLMGMLTLDEVLFLYNEYIKICDDVNPSLEQVTPEQFQLLIDAVRKKSVGIAELSLAQLKALAMSFQDYLTRSSDPE